MVVGSGGDKRRNGPQDLSCVPLTVRHVRQSLVQAQGTGSDTLLRLSDDGSGTSSAKPVTS